MNAKTIDYYQYMPDLWMGSQWTGLMQECEGTNEHSDFCYVKEETLDVRRTGLKSVLCNRRSWMCVCVCAYVRVNDAINIQPHGASGFPASLWQWYQQIVDI